MPRTPDGELYRIIGRRIRELRQLRELTIQKLADAIDLDPGFLGQIERGVGIPSINTLAHLAEQLEVPLAELFRMEAEVPSEEFFVKEVSGLLRRRSPKERRLALTLLRGLFKTYSKN